MKPYLYRLSSCFRVWNIPQWNAMDKIYRNRSRQFIFTLWMNRVVE